MTKRYKFRNNLRFRLAVFYSVVFFIFSGMIVFGFNVYINVYSASRPSLEEQLGRPDRRPAPVEIFGESYSDDNHSFYEKQFGEIVTQENFERLENFQKVSIVMLFPLAIISFFLGYFVSGYFMRPLSKLALKIKKLKSDNLGIKLEKNSDDEIGQLIESFNAMSVRLKESFDSQDEFVQNAAHELKTPLTIIQTNLDTALHRKNISVESYETAIKRSLVGMEKINLLTDSLLTLATPASDDFKKINFVALVNEQIDALKKNIINKKIKMHVDLPKEKVFVNADQHSLGRAVYNIIENAIKYSTQDKNPMVKIIVHYKEDKAILKVKNNGSQIPETEKENIFKRFYRVDKSRNSSQGGYGLGLAIVKKIIDNHRGKIYVETDKVHTIFVVEIEKLNKS